MLASYTMHRYRLIFMLAAFFAVTTGAGAQPQSPTLLVNPLIGTSTTPDGSDVIDDFPGADVPFGMVQWSPDTPSQNAGGGYEYGDHEITGFSLTHLSGPGCSVFGDFSVLPLVGPVTNPKLMKEPFSHASEEAAPGWYAVTLGNPGVRAELTVTKRTGLGRFTFPASTQASVLVNAASDQAGVDAAHAQIVGNDEIEGSVTSGGFCGMPDRYNAYFVAKFDRPFASVHQSFDSQQAWVTFDTSNNPVVRVKVALSFVNVQGALANLRAENRGWDILAVRNAASAQWQQMLQRIQISGGTFGERQFFYTAFYHALLHPNVYSDVTGLYTGYDNNIHHVRAGHVEYANYSDWDIYRTEMPLLALIAPKESSDMMQSLVDAAAQDGWLPRWALLNSATSVMGGDSVDPVIAGAYAFGARDFDLRGALAAMVKGASDTTDPPADGWYVERPELPEYLKYGYIINTHTTSVSPVPNGGSETLEYALDDFSIAQFARAIGRPQTYRTFMARSSNWANLFDTSSGMIAPRDPSGAFMHTPITDSGQSGFQEGNAAQYTWMVPQDLNDLIAGMGGRQAAILKLDTFFTQINAGQNKPYAWLGNEPTLGSPWVYLTAGAPWHAQQVVRQSLLTMFANTPYGYPGNDDLGTMSAWYIWCAIGLYPQNPSVRVLDAGSPLFTHVEIHAPGGPQIRIDAPQAADKTPYVQRLLVNGKETQRTWVRLPMHGQLALNFTLSDVPDKTWGAAPQDAPPSYAIAPVHFPPSSPLRLEGKELSAQTRPGGTVTFTYSLVSSDRDPAQTKKYEVTVPPDARAGLYDYPITGSANGAPLEPLTAKLLVSSGGVPPLGYIENRWDNTVTPIDPLTGAIGADIPAGTEPRDAVLSPDGKRLYVADRSGNAVTVIDTQLQRSIATIKVGTSANGVAISPDGKSVWVANYDDGTVQAIDTATLKAFKAIPVGQNPRQIAFTPDGKSLYVTNLGSNTVTRIDPATGTVVQTIAVGARPSGIAITPDGKRAYVADFGGNDVTPIDLTTDTAMTRIPVGVSPVLVAIAPDGSIAYVSNFAAATITPIDPASNTARAPITVGGAPYGIAFTHDSKTAYVVIRRDNACVRVDVRTGSISAPIRLGTSPYTIAM
jgi:predicted alpha-1,2-mannosidase